MSAYNDRQFSFVDSFLDEYTAKNGLDPRPSEWSLSERERYNKALARFIEQSPHVFDEPHVAVAREISSRPVRELDYAGFGEIAEVFFTEFTEQAERTNPFSEMNIGKVWLIAGVSIVVATAIFSQAVSKKIA